MQYLLLFLEGMITFVSPCFLPILPVYIAYFAGGKGTGEDRTKALRNAIGFVLGFTLVFVALGAFAGSIGSFLREYRTLVNIVSGSVVIVFGLNYLGVLRLNFANPETQGRLWKAVGTKPLTFFSAFLFGIVFSIGWTPCISAFLGAALLRAAQQGTMMEGMRMLFVFSMGLGLPLIASAILIDRMKGAFAFIKRHYRIINAFAGGLLVLVGILMMTGLFERLIALLI